MADSNLKTAERAFTASAVRRFLQHPFAALGPSGARWRRYDREGYLLFDPGLADRILDGAVRDLATRYENGQRIQDAWKFSDHVHAIARAPKILRMLAEYYGRPALPFQTLNFPFGTEQPVHSDTIHFNCIPSGYMCGVWVALEDIDLDNGPLVYYPGSHRLPEYNMADVGLPAVGEHYTHYERFIRGIIQGASLQPHHGTMKRGQALLWAANLLHGGSPRRDRTRTRLSQVTHYFFADCKYYTPLFSERDRVFWRDPQWIA